MPTRNRIRARWATLRPGESLLALEQEVVTLTNAERTAAGCAPLEWDDRLHQAAREHSTDMATHNYFSHTGRCLPAGRPAGLDGEAGRCAMGCRGDTAS